MRHRGDLVRTFLLLSATALACLIVVSCGSDPEPESPAQVEEIVPNAFDLPTNCEDLATFAEAAADAYDAAEVGTQALVDAKARFDAAVGEQVLLGCI